MWSSALLLLALPGWAPARADALDRVTQCTTRGFDADALDCRLCDALSTFLTSSTSQDQAKRDAVDRIGHECQDCCSDFSKVLEAEGRRYAKAVLAVSPYRLKWYPKVAHFVEKQAAQFHRLQVHETSTRVPMLQFYDDGGNKVEEISVAYWDETSIAEFIGKKLVVETDVGKKEEGDGDDQVLEMEVEADRP
ncbi:hypothetical protein PsorP6_010484 [Peronosclerospora sorghi]|uniref:Uncharacterized protein n=1 Tax=Peronosclerospora sorghi TaxID=230839 RepID=A0ACC0VTN8_9STRA|nr:hypothetical protein PsorP6_010484 [Peronosclerospora sorghi]